MKKKLLVGSGVALILVLALVFAACEGPTGPQGDPGVGGGPGLPGGIATVFFTSEVSPAALERVFVAAMRYAESFNPQLGNTTSVSNSFLNDFYVAVNISTGEPGSFPLHPELIGPFVQGIDGRIVETNVAYDVPGLRRFETADHLLMAVDRGYAAISRGGVVTILDDIDYYAGVEIGVPGFDLIPGMHLPHNYVGNRMFDYNFLVNLNHFSGHSMGGFGAAIKNLSIGLATAYGKDWIHNHGRDAARPGFTFAQYFLSMAPFQRSMAEAAFSVVAAFDSNHHPYGGAHHDPALWHGGALDMFGNPPTNNAQSFFDATGKARVLNITVMNNMSIYCDCFTDIAPPDLANIGIIASWDAVAIDQAAVDLIHQAFAHNRAHNIVHVEGVPTEPTARAAGRQAGESINWAWETAAEPPIAVAGTNRPVQVGRIQGEMMVQRIDQQLSVMALTWGERLGLGSRSYILQNVD